MHSYQQGRFERTKYHNVSGWRKQALRAMVKEACAVLMLHNCLYAQNDAIPERDNMQWEALVNQCGTIEFMITAHSQFLVMIFDYVIVQLQKNMKELVAIISFSAVYLQMSTPSTRIGCTIL